MIEYRNIVIGIASKRVTAKLTTEHTSSSRMAYYVIVNGECVQEFWTQHAAEDRLAVELEHIYGPPEVTVT